MLKEKFISITDLRKNASSYVWWIAKTWEKIIFVNNKPKAVLIDFDIYDKMIQNDKIDLYEVYEWTLSKDDIDELNIVKWMNQNEFYNI